MYGSHLVFPTLPNGAYIGEYKGQKAFIRIGEDKCVCSIILESATHLFGESLWEVKPEEITMYGPVDKENIIAEKQKLIDDLYKRINDYAANEDENKRGKIIAERILQEKQQRHNAQLRAVFYMLEQIEKVGTHREKEVVIRYIRQCIYEYLKNDGLDQYGCPDDLPF